MGGDEYPCIPEVMIKGFRIFIQTDSALFSELIASGDSSPPFDPLELVHV
jgi:hypothetical protein